MFARSIAAVLILSLLVSFGAIWVYMEGWEDASEVSTLSAVEYLSKRQQWVSRNQVQPEQTETAQEADQRQETEQAGRRVESLQEKREPSREEDEAEASPTLRAICLADWMNMARAQLAGLEQGLKTRQELFGTDCAEAMLTEPSTPTVESFLQNCVMEIDAVSEDLLQGLCVETLPEVKAFATRELGDQALQLERPDEEILREQLVGAFVGLGAATEEDLQENIEIAEELIAEDPDSYMGYKAKLVSLLLTETKYDAPASMDEYTQLYDEMIRFGDEAQAAQTGSGELEMVLGGAPEIGDLDPDLVHIPFLRLSALGEFDELETMAADYIATYPNSYIGYLYAADSLWRSGQREAAIEALRGVFPGQESGEALYTLFEQYQRLTPVDRIEQMGLGVE